MAFGYPKYMRRRRGARGKVRSSQLHCRYGKVKRGPRKGRCLKNRRTKK